jgi:hypothetical protein
MMLSNLISWAFKGLLYRSAEILSCYRQSLDRGIQEGWISCAEGKR